MKHYPTLAMEQQHDWPVCGIDEAGRGPWAGPVVAAAIIWHDLGYIPSGLNDSKQLSRSRREFLFPLIMEHADVGIGICEASDIDRLNILQATKLAMQRACEALRTRPAVALVDGNQPPALPCQTICVIKGDSLSLSIAAASVIAKVTRDRLMESLAQQFPQYGWERNAGYGTAEHQHALRQHGVTPHHRRSYAPIRALLTQEAAA